MIDPWFYFIVQINKYIITYIYNKVNSVCIKCTHKRTHTQMCLPLEWAVCLTVGNSWRIWSQDELEKFELAAKSHWLHFLALCRCFSSCYILHNTAVVLCITASVPALHTYVVCRLDWMHLLWWNECMSEISGSGWGGQMRLLRTSSATGFKWKTPAQWGWAGTFDWPFATTNKNVERVAMFTVCARTPTLLPNLVRMCVRVWVCMLTNT